MGLLYSWVNNFGLAVIIFTVLVKAASFPLSLKQQKNMSVSQLFTPRVQEIQKKYRGNQAKLQEEMQKLQKEGYNPMGGCGPMILIMIILFGVLDVVYKPMTHMERFDREVIAHVQDLGRQVEYTSILLSNEEALVTFLEYREISAPPGRDGNLVSNEQRREIGEYIINNPMAAGITDSVRSAMRTADGRYRGLQRELQALRQFSLSPDAFPLEYNVRERLGNLADNMHFIGINLGEVPQFGTVNRLWFIVLACFIFTVAQSYIQYKIQKKTMPTAPNMKMMLMMGPIFTLFIGFSFPAGAVLYWSVSSLFTIGQSLLIFKVWPPEKMRAEAAEKLKAKTGMSNVTAKVVDVDNEGNETVKEEKLSDMSKREQDEYFKKKLEAARKEDLEKYGETPDIDLSQHDKKHNKTAKEPEPEPEPENIDSEDKK
jgi:YidC/Oxa1 family membrane protein insertase